MVPVSEDKSNDVVENIKETVEEVVDDVKETVEEAVEAVEDAVDNAKPALIKLKEENPKVFYGGIAGIVVVLGFIFLSGGSSSVKQHAQAAISIGQSYTLKAPNSVGESTLKILKVPGSMTSFDNPEDVVCKAPVGASVVARDFKDAFGKKQLFVQVEILQEIGDCRQGAKGWTLKNNLK
ncbi:conserved hypothetical protein [Bathymodiolus platifrons methanotrophic gill symbiont]|nr:hypothetical protein BMR08_08990 [Methylococcaceae bacterium CS2]TXL10504.1 hypothetical protein BMR08_08995 [Methylococcaceae bacterium CS2]GAW85330.1 conserved hypothetical protein [Bathymodiolus platifrons methanotrophic gill symbiont]